MFRTGAFSATSQSIEEQNNFAFMNIADFRPSKRIQPWKHYAKDQKPYSLDIRYIGADPNKDMAMMS